MHVHVLSQVYAFNEIALNAFNEILQTNFVDIEYQIITILCSHMALSVLTLHVTKNHVLYRKFGQRYCRHMLDLEKTKVRVFVKC